MRSSSQLCDGFFLWAPALARLKGKPDQLADVPQILVPGVVKCSLMVAHGAHHLSLRFWFIFTIIPISGKYYITLVKSKNAQKPTRYFIRFPGRTCRKTRLC